MIISHMLATRKRVKCLPGILPFLFLFASGCAPVISKELRTQVAREITFTEVRKNPDLYKGKLVLWGGVIIGAKNVKEGTLLEVLQTPTDRRGRPKDVDQSGGRFMALYDGYLDVAIYSQGREVTVAGEITGKKVLPLAEITYQYPLIAIKEIHLIKEEKYYPYPYWWYPPWWYYPYSDPWW
ncbi:MAG: Slp family lipoprotein [Desulfatiglandales bacterium]